jgi:hypothetical protein
MPRCRPAALHGKVAGAGGLAGSPDVLRSVVRMGVRFVSAGMADAAQAFAQDRDAMIGSMVRPRAPDATAAARSCVLQRS